MDETPLACSFCERPVTAVRYLITAPRAAICDECVWVCVDLIPPGPPKPGEPVPVLEAA